MIKKYIFLTTLSFFCISLNTPLDTSLFEWTYGGYIKYEFYADTRQIIASGNGQTLFLPREKLFDSACRDINDRAQTTMVAIETRMNVDVKGPIIKDIIKTGAYVEADFFGGTLVIPIQTINHIQLRHAYITLEWPKVKFLTGQTWHPLFITYCSPDTIANSTGAPIECGVRQPQTAVTYQGNDFNIHATISSQTPDSASDGPLGISTRYIRRSKMPEIYVRIENNHYGDNRFGIAFDTKRLIPRDVNLNRQRVHESITSFTTFAYALIQKLPLKVCTKIAYIENCHDQGILGGYALSTYNPITDKRTYTNLRFITAWIDLAWKKPVEPGLFIGYGKNIGSSKPVITSITLPNGLIEPTIYAFGSNIDNVFRIAPRVRWFYKQLTIATEIEYTRAAYGTITNNGTVIDTNPVGNTRLLFALYYNF